MKFADTSWWIAWAFPGDGRHHDALAALASVAPTEEILSSNLVLGETWTFLRRRDSHRTAVDFLDRVESLGRAGRLVTQRVTEAQERTAWDWLRRHDEREYSFVDATSFRVMRDRRLREALAFGGDFSAAGFVEVRG